MMRYSNPFFTELSFIQGMASVLDIGNTLTEYQFFETPEEADLAALSYDWNIVGEELAGAMTNYERKR